MNRKIGFILVFVLLLFLAACEEKILEPTVYIPDNADHAMLFRREVYTDGYNFTIGYNNGLIRPTIVRLSWGIHPSGLDSNYLATKLYRDGTLIKTINSREVFEFTDVNLTQDRYYTYTIAQLVNTGMNVYDTLTVKTPSIAAPTLELSVPSSSVVKLFWIDRSDISGAFVVTRNNIELNTFVTFIDGVYSYADTQVYPNNNYTYHVYKDGDFDQTAVVQQSVYVQSTLTTPVLQSVTQEFDGVRIQWTDLSTAEDQIKIYRKLYGDPDTAYSVVGSILLPNQTEFLDRTFHYTGQRYTYAVSAVNRYLSPPVETPKSNDVSITYGQIESSIFDFEDNDLTPFVMNGNVPWTLVNGGSSKGWTASSGNLNNYHTGNSEMNYFHNIPFEATTTIEFDIKSIHQTAIIVLSSMRINL
ncbi:MAG: hypothetical protein CVU48_02460 [Candidatus Cloacimonetes bacterium HGW-Cloacimonetes-1]|nr:MAG: hypothetical protein CVU48_02460 [Candidatus Cloacimonetes bacterium HGW-Cloacimonetes-1]